MQVKIGTFKTLTAALQSVREKLDELPHYHGKVLSYTIVPITKTKFDVLINRKAIEHGAI